MFTGRCPVGYFDSPHCCLNHFNIFKSRDFLVPTFVGLTGLTWFNPPTRVFHVFPNPSPVPFPKPPGLHEVSGNPPGFPHPWPATNARCLGSVGVSARAPWGYGETCIVMSIGCLLLHHQSLSELWLCHNQDSAQNFALKLSSQKHSWSSGYFSVATFLDRHQG